MLIEVKGVEFGIQLSQNERGNNAKIRQKQLSGKIWKLPKVGKSKADTKVGKYRKHSKNKLGNFQSLKAQFPNGMKYTRMETSLRTQTC